jgi:hypothetical protein
MYDLGLGLYVGITSLLHPFLNQVKKIVRHFKTSENCNRISIVVTRKIEM